MTWQDLEHRSWRKVTIDLTDLEGDDRFKDPTLTKPPIIKVELVGARPDPDQQRPHTPEGYAFLWHDLQPEHKILFVGIEKNPSNRKPRAGDDGRQSPDSGHFLV